MAKAEQLRVELYALRRDIARYFTIEDRKTELESEIGRLVDINESCAKTWQNDGVEYQELLRKAKANRFDLCDMPARMHVFILLRLVESRAEQSAQLWVFGRQIDKLREQLESEIAWHSRFDWSKAERRISEVSEQIKEHETALDSIRREHDLIARAISLVQPKIDELDAADVELRRRKELVTPFAERLGKEPKGSALLAQIYREAQAVLGPGNPTRMLTDIERQLESNGRSREKLIRRGEIEIMRAQRAIDTIIIDGNNMCYRDDPDGGPAKFIGLAALDALVSYCVGILRSPWRVCVVFDASIVRLARLDETAIRRLLSPAEVTFATEGSQADEIMLNLAASFGGVGGWIVSNDRFIDYHDKDVVRARRVLRFRITLDTLLVDELDITVPLSKRVQMQVPDQQRGGDDAPKQARHPRVNNPPRKGS